MEEKEKGVVYIAFKQNCAPSSAKVEARKAAGKISLGIFNSHNSLQFLLLTDGST